MGIFTAIGANVGKAVAEAAKPALQIVDKAVVDKDLANEIKRDIEVAYQDKHFGLKMALASGNELQKLIEPFKELTKVIIIACIFIIFPLVEAIWGLHIDIVKYLDSMPIIGWVVLVAADLGPTITNRVLDYQLHKETLK